MQNRLTKKSIVKEIGYVADNPTVERCVKVIDKLGEYEDAEESGLLVRLPCKVGDTVYYINTVPHIALYQNTIYKAEVARIVTTHLGTSIVIQIHNDYGCTEIPNINDIGKTVFLTREEAGKALEEDKQRAETEEV